MIDLLSMIGVGALLVCAVGIAAWAIPVTRPYVRWITGAAGGLAVAAIALFRTAGMKARIEAIVSQQKLLDQQTQANLDRAEATLDEAKRTKLWEEAEALQLRRTALEADRKKHLAELSKRMGLDELKMADDFNRKGRL